MPGLSQSLELADGRRAAYEVVGDGTPLFYFQGGPGFSAALLRRDAELLADAVLGAELIIVRLRPFHPGRSTRVLPRGSHRVRRRITRRCSSGALSI
jgi:hypothetical protein